MPSTDPEEDEDLKTPQPNSEAVAPSSGVRTEPPEEEPIGAEGAPSKQDVTKSFAAQGYGAPSAGYNGPPLGVPPSPEPVQAPVAETDEEKEARYGIARLKADHQHEQDWSAAHPFDTTFERPKLTEDDYKQAERQSDLEYQQNYVSQARAYQEQQKEAQKAAEAQREQQFRATGQKYMRDQFGRIQPLLEPGSNRPLFDKKSWFDSQDPKTGEYAQEMRDQYGQRQFRAGAYTHGPDPSDSNAYIKRMDGTLVDSGKTWDDLAKGPDLKLRFQALGAIAKRNAAQRQEGLDAIRATVAVAQQPYQQASDQAEMLQNQYEQLQARIAAAQNGTLPGGPQDVTALEQQAQAIQDQFQKVSESLKPGGQPYQQKYIAERQLQRATALHKYQTYADQQKQIEARLEASGKSPQEDPAWTANNAAMSQWKNVADSLAERTQSLQNASANQPPGNQEPAALLQQGRTRIGATPLQEIAQKYGDGSKPATPQQLVDMANRAIEINETLHQSGSNLDPRVTNSMQEESQYLSGLLKGRLDNLAPGDKQSVLQAINSQHTTAAGAFGRHAGLGALPAASGLVGAEVGGNVGSRAGPWGALVGSLVGGVAGSILGNKAQEQTLQAVSPEFKANLDKYLAIDEKEHPFAAEAGDFVSQLPFFKANGPKQHAAGLVALMKAATKQKLTAPEVNAVRTLAMQAGIGAGTAAVTPMTQAQKPTASQWLHDTAQALIFGEGRFGHHVVPEEHGPAPAQAPQPPGSGPAPAPANPAAPPPAAPAAPTVPVTQASPQSIAAHEAFDAANAARGATEEVRKAANAAAPAAPEAPAAPQTPEERWKARQAAKKAAAAPPAPAEQAEATQAIADQNRANRQKLVEAGRDEHTVAKLTNQEVHDALVREGIHPKPPPTQPATPEEKPNVNPPAPDQATVRNQESEAGRKGSVAPREPGQGGTPETVDNGSGRPADPDEAGREGNGPAPARGEAGGSQLGAGAAAGAGSAPVHNGAARDASEAPRGAHEEPRRVSGEPREPERERPASDRRGPGRGELTADEVSDLGAKEVREHAHAAEGGLTGAAIRAGEAAEGKPDEIAKLEAHKAKAELEAQKAREAGDVDSENAFANKAQFFSEAYQKATKTGNFAENGPADRLNAMIEREKARAAAAKAPTEEPRAKVEPAASAPAGGDRSPPPDTQRSSDAADTSSPAGASGSGEQKKVLPRKKGKRFSVGLHPEGHEDILSHIEQGGGIKPRSEAVKRAKLRGERPGGEYDGQDEAFSGRAKMLLRKNGPDPDQVAQELHAQGIIPEPDVNTMHREVQKAVQERKDAAARLKRSAYENKFDRAFMDNDRSRTYLRNNESITADELEKGDHFEVNGEKFTVKDVAEDGRITVQDGVKRVLEPGQPINPDRGIVAKEGETVADKRKAVDKALDALRKLKIHKLDENGNNTTPFAATPFSLAWDGALDVAIGAIKAGRAVHEAIQAAIQHFREKLPDHDEEAVADLREHLAKETANLVPKEKPAENALGAEKPPEPPAKGGELPLKGEEDPLKETSVKNAVVDQEREARGLPPAMQAAKKSFGVAWDHAMQALKDNPDAGQNLVDELKNKARPITDDEDALLLHHQIDLQNQFDKLAEKINSGAASDVDLTRQAELSQKLLDTYNAGKSVGTENARGLNARKMLAREDYSLAKMETRLRAAKRGEELTPAEKGTIEKLQKKISELQEAHEKALQDANDRASLAEMDNEHLRLKERVANEKPVPPAQKSAVSEYIKQKAAEARKNILERMKKVNDISSVLREGPGAVKDLALIGAEYIDRGLTRIAEFAREWRREFGETSNKDVHDIYTASIEQHRNAGKALGGRDTEAERQATLAGMEEHMKEPYAEIGDLGRYANKLAEQYVREGVTDREKLIDAVHEHLKQVVPGISRRDAMDAISGYGKFKPLDQDKVKQQLRDLRGQMQAVGKLQDMAAGQAPAKTGVERRTPSAEERRLIQQVNEEKRKGGFNVTDPAKQLKTALEGIKTRLRNSISDLNFQISTGKKIVRTKTDVVRDPEALALEKNRDELKAQFDSIFKKPGLTDAQRLAAAQKSVDRQIADIQDQLKSGMVGKTAAPKPLDSPQLKAARAQLEALKQEREYARMLLAPEPRSPEEIANQAYRTRTAKRIAELEAKLAAGDVSKTPRRVLAKDAASEAAAAQLAGTKLAFDRMVRAKELANAPLWEKSLTQLSGAAHAAALSGYHTLAKLAGFSAWRMLEIPAHEMVGNLASKLPGFEKIYSRANMEGGAGGGVQAAAKFFSSMAKEGPQEALNYLRQGATTSDLLYGKKEIEPGHWYDAPGRLHGTEKAILRTGVERMYESKAAAAAAKEGRSVSEAELKEAHEYAKRQILQEDNKAAKWLQQGIDSLKKVDPKTGHKSAIKVATATFIEGVLTKGIVRLPMNYMMQTIERTPAGLMTGGGKAIAAAARAKKAGNWNSLTPHEANAIARLITTGSLGTGVFLAGMVDGWKDDPNDRIAGGYYQPGEKRYPGDVKVGALRIAGHEIPHLLTHNPLTESFQMGSTLSRVLKSELKKHSKANHTAVQAGWDSFVSAAAGKDGLNAALATFGGLLQESPVENSITKMGNLTNPNRAGSAMAEIGQGQVPGLLQNIAQDTDTSGVKRDPESFLDGVKMGIPGARETVKPKQKPMPKSLRSGRPLFGSRNSTFSP